MMKGKAAAANKPTKWKELHEGIARKTPTTWKEWLLAIPVYSFLIALVWFLIRFFLTMSLRRLLGYLAFFAFIALLVYLKSVSKRAERVIEGAFNYNGIFLAWMVVTFSPIYFFYWLASYVLNKSTILQVTAFVFWGLLLTFGSVAVFTEKHRERVLPWLQLKIGKLAPCAYAFNLLIIAWLFFSSVTFVLVSHGVLRLDRPTAEVSAEGLVQPPAQISVDDIKEFYGRHFLQAIPLLRINETLRWKEPLTYQDSSVGLLILLFQFMVILPVIRAFAWYWKHVEPRRKKLRRIRRLSSQPYS